MTTTKNAASCKDARRTNRIIAATPLFGSLDEAAETPKKKIEVISMDQKERRERLSRKLGVSITDQAKPTARERSTLAQALGDYSKT